MSEILVIQNAKNEGIGTLGRLFEEDGFRLRPVLAKREPIPMQDHKAIVILGAPESANDDLEYLRKEMDIVRQSVKNNVPVLGICLGSQIIAKAFGASVYKGRIKEIGFYTDVEFDNTAKSKIFHGIQSPATVFHWHGDTFDLPENAIRLAHSREYQNQAIKIGSAVGVQFHLEVEEQSIRSWLENAASELASVPYIHTDEIIKAIPKYITSVQETMQTFYRNLKAEFDL
ncbi:MAG: gamma-glutamyl-gamma-aminobutyrate hydrolase family protein [Thaumarchaeota archaeon]|nr:gamma-glutamyl-gamma-aminobutyrate hydrolase family protein [Nitrososphaerota archaeon]